MIEAKVFLKDVFSLETELRVTDTRDPNALFPIGTVFTCERGHEVCSAVESIHDFQLIEERQFGKFRRGQPIVRDGQSAGKCHCGASWGRKHGISAQLHTAKGWVPDYSEPLHFEKEVSMPDNVIKTYGDRRLDGSTKYDWNGIMMLIGASIAAICFVGIAIAGATS